MIIIIPNSRFGALSSDDTSSGQDTDGGYIMSDGDPEYATAAGVSGEGYIYGPDIYGSLGKYRLAYIVSGSNATLIGWDGSPGYVQPGGFLTIPSSVSDGLGTYFVTAIERYSFQACSGIISVAIPSSITDIGSAAFAGCHNLLTIDVDNDNLNYVSDNGILYNKSKTELVIYPAGKLEMSFSIPSGVTHIGDMAFRSTKLTSITMPSSVIQIGESIFSLCAGLTAINVDNDNMYYVSDNGVLYDRNKTEIISYPAAKGGLSFSVPSGVKSVANYAFYNCNTISSVTIPNTVTHIGDMAFNGCTALASITLPSEITHIGSYAFYNCSKLTSIAIPSEVMHIGGFAFGSCTGLTSMTIPSSVTHIGIGIFSNCTNLTAITVDTNNGNYVSDNGVLYNMNKTELMSYPIGKAGTTFSIPSTVTNIGNNVFYNCTKLTSVTIPSSVTHIGENAFQSCTALVSMTIPDTVTHIGNFAFNNCTNLTSINIPSSVRYIGDYAFQSCIGLTSITIQPGVTHIGNFAFNNCTKLTSITIPSSVTHLGNNVFYNCTALVSMTIPSSVKYMGYNIISNCTNLTTISVDVNSQDYSSENGVLYNKSKTEILSYPLGKTGVSFSIPASVTQIGNFAFYNCIKLTSLTMGSNVTHIGENAFQNCSALISIMIPDSVSYLGNSAFQGCISLTSMDIPSGVTHIGNEVFADCGKLMSITMGPNVTYIGNNAFHGTAVTTMDLPSSVMYIGNNAFRNCMAMSSITMPSSLIYIGNYAFNSCTALASIIIPSSVMYIDRSAFYSSVKEVTFEGETLPFVGSNAFNGNIYYSHGTRDEGWWSSTQFTFETEKRGVYYDLKFTSLDGDLFQGTEGRFRSTAGNSNVTIMQTWVDSLPFSLRYSVDEGVTWIPKSDLVGKTMTSDIIGIGVIGKVLKYDAQGGEGRYMQGGEGILTLYDGSGYYKRGYILEGWTTQPNGMGAFFQLGEKGYSLSEDATLYAEWKPIEYQIEFDGNGSTGGFMENMKMTYDSYSELDNNAFVCDGYVFMGWSLTPGGSVIYADGKSVINLTDIDGDSITLYAIWEVLPVPPVPESPRNSVGTIVAVAAIAGAAVAVLGFAMWYRNKDNEEEDL